MLEQDPTAGEKADEGSTVVLTVSSGPGTVAIPDVAGQAPGEARRALEDVGLEVETEERFSDTVADGRVIGTEPAAATQVAGGSTVKLLVSKGSNQLDVPNLVGLSTEDAVAQIEALELSANIQQTEDPAPVGRVLSQTPSPGQKVKKGAQVTIFVSTGTMAVPNVVGTARESAVTTLKKAGFKVTVTLDSAAEPSQSGLVTSQFPIGGSGAPRGSTVQISVGAPPSEPTTTQPTP